jgi:hypothetical protein
MTELRSFVPIGVLESRLLHHNSDFIEKSYTYASPVNVVCGLCAV